MRISAQLIRFFNCGLLTAGFLLVAGLSHQAAAQERDPFAKPFIRGSKGKAIVTGTVQKPPKPVPTIVTAPPIQDRIDSYKAMRVKAAEVGVPAPKPTSVLTVSEIEVTGIFRTPRGYAAMVEATPIKLSYTVYPGEKFFDGYLVAIEENRLVFRRETRMTDGKVINAAENKGMKLPVLNDMLVPRVETASNTAAPVQTNPTVTVPATAVPSTPNAPVSEAKATEEIKTVSNAKSVESVAQPTAEEPPTDNAAPKIKPSRKTANSKPTVKRAKTGGNAPKQVLAKPTF